MEQKTLNSKLLDILSNDELFSLTGMPELRKLANEDKELNKYLISISTTDELPNVLTELDNKQNERVVYLIGLAEAIKSTSQNTEKANSESPEEDEPTDEVEDAEDDAEDDSEEDSAIKSNRVLAYSIKDDVIKMFKKAILENKLFFPIVWFFLTLYKILSYLKQQFFNLLDLIGKLVSAESLYDALDIAAEKNKLIFFVMAIIATLMDFLLSALAIISTALGWYNNPFKKVTQVVKSRTKTGNDGDTDSTGDSEISTEPAPTGM